MNIKSLFIAGSAALLLGPGSTSAYTVFMEDFESITTTGGPAQYVTTVSGTRDVSCSSKCPFSSGTSSGGKWIGDIYDNSRNDNFGIHQNTTNRYAGGNGGAPSDPTQFTKKYNPNMAYDADSGKFYGDTGAPVNHVLGHVKNTYDTNEKWRYSIYDIDLGSAQNTDIQLMFDFDSWIAADTDGFAVSFREEGSSDWELLNPTSASDMQYRNLGDANQHQSNWTNYANGSGAEDILNSLSGFDGGSSDLCDGTNIGTTNNCGYDGHNSGNTAYMAGIAMFDLTDLAGQKIDLRFSFASNDSGSPGQRTCDLFGERLSCNNEEGINIDNIKITACAPNDPNCNPPPPPGIPEPASLALMMLGATAMYRRRKYHSLS